VIQLGDASDVLDPLSDRLLEPLDEIWVLKPILKVIGRHLEAKSPALFALGLDLWLMDELDLRHDDILLTLEKMYLQLSQVLLDALKSCRC
jgi:hypothetical protein